MIYETLMHEPVGYRPRRSFIGEGKPLLDDVTFGEVAQPYLEGLEGDLHLYLRIKDDLEHIKADKNHLRQDDPVDLFALGGFYLEKMYMQMAMILLKNKTDDPLRDKWDSLTLEDYLKGQEETSISLSTGNDGRE